MLEKTFFQASGFVRALSPKTGSTTRVYLKNRFSCTNDINLQSLLPVLPFFSILLGAVGNFFKVHWEIFFNRTFFLPKTKRKWNFLNLSKGAKEIFLRYTLVLRVDPILWASLHYLDGGIWEKRGLYSGWLMKVKAPFFEHRQTASNL